MLFQVNSLKCSNQHLHIMSMLKTEKAYTDNTIDCFLIVLVNIRVFYIRLLCILTTDPFAHTKGWTVLQTMFFACACHFCTPFYIYSCAFSQLTPLHTPQAGLHSRPCFLHVHLSFLHPILHPHLMIPRRDFGAAAKSV